MTGLRVISGPGPVTDQAAALVDAITALCQERAGNLSLAAVIGALQIVQFSMMRGAEE